MVPDVDLDAAEDLGVEHLDVAVQDAVGPGVVVPDAVARDVVDLDAVGLDAVVLDVVVGHVVELMDALVQDVASVKKKHKINAHIKSSAKKKKLPVLVAVAACVTSLATGFDVAYDYKRPLAVVDLDFVLVVLILHLEHDALVAFVGQLLIAKHEAVAKFAKYFE